MPVGLPPLPPLTFTLEVLNPGAYDDPDSGPVFTALSRGVMLAAQWIQGLWIRTAHELGVSVTGAYVRGIDQEGRFAVEKEPTENGEWWEVIVSVTNTAPHASIVEDGHGPFNLPQAIDWSSTTGRIKRGKNGPYLHIPFRHFAYVPPSDRSEKGTSRMALRNMMPKEVYRDALKLRYTRPTNAGPIYQGGQFIAADRYTWAKGSTPRQRRLDRVDVPPGFRQSRTGELYEERRGERIVGRDRSGKALINPAWKTSKFAGMMKTGGPKHTRYLTVRTLTPNSQGWNIPAMAGYGVARKVAYIAGTSPELPALVVRGIEAALRRRGPQ